MPPAALAPEQIRHNELFRQNQLSILQARCAAVAATAVAVLDEQNPASDFSRWMREISKAALTAGNDFYAALWAPGEGAARLIVPRVPANAGNILDGNFFGIPEPPELRQLALRSLIGNSIATNGEAHKLIQYKPHAGGAIDAAGAPDVAGDNAATARNVSARGIQAFQVLRNRFEVAEQPLDASAAGKQFLNMSWPTTGLATDYQLHMAKVVRLAEELSLDATDALRALWWRLVAEPPADSPYFSAAGRARVRTNGQRATIAHRRTFYDVMLQEVALDERARTAAGLAASVTLDACASSARKSSGGTFRQRGADDGKAGGLPTRRLCVRCADVHPRGFPCRKACLCDVCGSTAHGEHACWIKHGPTSMLYSLPVHVALQYTKWHEDYKRGTYRKQTGGPVVGTREQVLRAELAESAGSSMDDLDAAAAINPADAEFLADQISRVDDEALCEDADKLLEGNAETAALSSFHTFLPESDDSAYMSQFGACGAKLDTSTNTEDKRLLMQLRAELEGARRESLVLRQQVQLSMVSARSTATPIQAPETFEDLSPPTPSRAYAVGSYSPFKGAVRTLRKEADEVVAVRPASYVPAFVAAWSVLLVATCIGTYTNHMLVDGVANLAQYMVFAAVIGFIVMTGATVWLLCLWLITPVHAAGVANQGAGSVYNDWPIRGLLAQLTRVMRHPLPYAVLLTHLLDVRFSQRWATPPSVSLVDGTIGLLEPSVETLACLRACSASPSLRAINVATRHSTELDSMYPHAFLRDSTLMLYDTGCDVPILTSSKCVHITRPSPPLRIRVADGSVRPVFALGATCVTFSTDAGLVSVQASGVAVVHDFPKPLWSHGYAAQVLDISARFGSRSSPSSYGLLSDGSRFHISPPPYHFRAIFSMPNDHSAIARASAAALAVKVDSAALWHARLMHISPSRMTHLSKHVDGTPLSGVVTLPGKCHICMENTSRRRHLASHAIVSKVVGAMTHSDWIGPLAEDLYFKCRYAVCFVDDKSRFKWVFFTRDRTFDSFQVCFSAWCSKLAQYGYSVSGLTTDQGPELVSHDAFDFMDEWAVLRALSCRYRQSQDGVAESLWRVAFMGVRASLNSCVSDRQLRRRLWALALHQRVNVIGNGFPTVATGMVSPHSIVTHEKLNLSHVRTMWCAAAAHIPVATRGEHHTDRVARMGVHCGQSSVYKGYIIYFPDDHTFDHCIDVEFDEAVYPLLTALHAPPPLPLASPIPPAVPHLRGTLVPPTSVGPPPVRHPERVPLQLVAGSPPRTQQPARGRPPVHATPPGRLHLPMLQQGGAQPGGAGIRAAPLLPPGAQPRRPGSRSSSDVRYAADCVALRHFFSGRDSVRAASTLLTKALEAYVEPQNLCWEAGATLAYVGSPLFGPPFSSAASAFFQYEEVVHGGVTTLDAAKSRIITRWVGQDGDLKPLHVPQSYRAMSRGPHAPRWHEGCLREMQSQWECKTWTLVPRAEAQQHGGNIITCRWVFDAKVRDGAVAVWKARLVARGFEQVAGVDFEDWYFGAVRPSTVRFFFAMSAMWKLIVYQADVCTAYLNAELQDVVVYMEQPEGFAFPAPDGTPAAATVCRLHKALYGLVQSAREWGMTFREFMLSMRFVRSGADPQLYYKVDDVSRIMVAVCVDDLLIASNDTAMRTEFMGMLAGRFKIKDLGVAEHAIGFDVTQDLVHGVVRLHLSTYIASAATRFQLDMSGAVHDVPAPLSMVHACVSAVPTMEEIQSVHEEYARLVGVLVFITSYVRLDTVAAVHFLARFVSRPGNAHVRLARRVLRYLWHTRELGLTYHGGGEFDVSAAFMPEQGAAHGLHAGSDSDWATGPSTTAFVVMLGGAAVGWAARVQRGASLSSAEAEFYALSEAVAEVVHFRNLLEDVGVHLDTPTVVFCDSRGARLLAVDVASSRRTRHIHRRWFFVQFCVDEGQVVIRELRGRDNFANCLSKCTSGKTFLAERRYLLGMTA